MASKKINTLIIRSLFVFLTLTGASSAIAFAGSELKDTPPKTLNLGYIEFYPFYETVNGVAKGVLVDLAKEVTKEAGYGVKLFPLPTKRMARSVAEGETDLFVGLKTLPEFKGTTVTGNIEILNLELRLFSFKETPSYKGIESLSGKRVILMRGYSYGGMLKELTNSKNNVKYYFANNHKSAVRMLEAGRADYLLHYKFPATKALKELNLEKKAQWTRLSSFGVYFVVSKSTNGHRKILKDLENAYSKLLKKGVVQKILN